MQINRPTVQCGRASPSWAGAAVRTAAGPQWEAPQPGRARSRQNECAGAGPAHRRPRAHGSCETRLRGRPHHGQRQWRAGKQLVEAMQQEQLRCRQSARPLQNGWLCSSDRCCRLDGSLSSLAGRGGAGAKLGSSEQVLPPAGLGARPLGCYASWGHCGALAHQAGTSGPHARAAAARAAAQRRGKLLQRAAQAAQAAAQPPLAAAQGAGFGRAAALQGQGLGGGGCRAAHAIDGAGGAGQRHVLCRAGTAGAGDWCGVGTAGWMGGGKESRREELGNEQQANSSGLDDSGCPACALRTLTVVARRALCGR